MSERIDYASMSGPELLASVRDDAHKWAEAFQQIVIDRGIPLTDSLMIGWFANAIEHSETVRRHSATPPPLSEPGFLDEGETETRPQVFLQWKGTDVCMDFYCACGAQCHYDGYFAYVVKCPHCQRLWEMPCHVYPREVTDKTYPGHVKSAKLLEPDEDFETGEDFSGDAS